MSATLPQAGQADVRTEKDYHESTKDKKNLTTEGELGVTLFAQDPRECAASQCLSIGRGEGSWSEKRLSANPVPLARELSGW
jgi:hypothetical protein